MTPAEVQAAVERARKAKEIADKATPGRWTPGGAAVFKTVPFEANTNLWTKIASSTVTQEDANFIAAARTGWPETADDVIALGQMYQDACAAGHSYRDERDALAERLAVVEAQRDAYQRAKAENDDRFMIERDEARAEVERLRTGGSLPLPLVDAIEARTNRDLGVLSATPAPREALDRSESIASVDDRFVLIRHLRVMSRQLAEALGPLYTSIKVEREAAITRAEKAEAALAKVVIEVRAQADIAALRGLSLVGVEYLRAIADRAEGKEPTP